MEDPNCPSISEMKLYRKGDKIKYAKWNSTWTVVDVVEKGLVLATSPHGGHRHLVEWGRRTEFELPDDFYQSIGSSSRQLSAVPDANVADADG